ncbi:MAG TPA: adenylate/guanylate cyclase domain-containing protein [Actinomycetota bacterium]|nr:adenylate/guanylate cyclase domain-containing protein [Actinomycetota bacterium]
MPLCRSCGQENPAIARFCLNCGRALESRRRPATEERKVVTVLFCDLVGFTAISDNADPEDVRDTLRPYHERLREEIERFGGTVEKFIGDAVMAVWGAPVAHEDDAERAVRTGLDILHAIRDLNERQPNLQLAVRIGINTGEAMVSLQDPVVGEEAMVAGDVVNTAARIETSAPPESVVVGEATYRATRDLFDYEELGTVQVKGKSQPLSVWKANAPRFPQQLRPATRSTPFVGREDELELLKRVYARARREPSVQLVTLIGEPGAGKTRLTEEFSVLVTAQDPKVRSRQGRCLPYGEGITFWPLGEVIKGEAGILETDSLETAERKLEAAVEAAVEDTAEREWLALRLGPLIGVHTVDGAAEGRREESFSAWRRFIDALASATPLILLFEDLHWADDAMVDFIEHLVDWSSGVPMLVLCTTRPELFEHRPGWGGGKRNSTTISLPPLSGEEMEELLSALLPPAELGPETRGLILQRAEGNPLYAEEFIGMLTEQRLTARETAQRGDVEARLPDSIQAIIAARLDTLPPERKSLLQDAAVLGNTFWSGALAFMGAVEEGAVRAGLHELTRKELVRPSRSSSMKDQSEFSFWHFLIADVAYMQIPRAARAKKHRKAAEWTEQVAGERVADYVEVLAYHYSRGLELALAAGDSTEAGPLRERARRFLTMAGDRAMAFDVAKAAEHYRRAVSLFDVDDPDRAVVLTKAAEATGRAGQFTEAEGMFEQAINDSMTHGNIVAAAEAMVKFSILLWFRGDTSACRDLLQRAIDLLEREAPGPQLVLAYVEMGSDRVAAGALREAVEWSEKALALADKLGVDDQKPRALAHRGTARAYLGDLGGIDDVRKALEVSFELGLSRETARVHAILADLLWITEGPVPALEDARTGIELSEGRGNVELAMAIRVTMLGPLFDLGKWDQVVETAEYVAKWSRANGEQYFAVLADSMKARVRLLRGAVDEATALAAAVLSPAREIGDQQVLVPVLSVAALTEHARGNDRTALEHVSDVVDATREAAWQRAVSLIDLVQVAVSCNAASLGEELLDGVESSPLRHRLSLLSSRGMLEEARGNSADAVKLYEDAADGWGSYGCTFEAGRASLGMGRCLLALGRSDGGNSLEAARRTFEELKAEPFVMEAEQLLGGRVNRDIGDTDVVSPLPHSGR